LSIRRDYSHLAPHPLVLEDLERQKRVTATCQP
jgi:hypothetical protein